jgi:hypothetical protein
MTTQRILVGTVVGGIVLTLLGFLVFVVLFGDFFMSNAGSATGVQRDPMDFVSLVIGQLAWGAVLTLILGWTSTSSIAQGAKTAGLVGLLFMLGIDLTMYATTNLTNLTATLVDPVLGAIVFAVAGAAIAAVTARKAAA